MASSPLPPASIPPSKLHTTLLSTYVDIPFNIYLIPILLVTTTLALHSRTTLLLAVLLTTTLILTHDTTSTRGETIKLICVLPLGLGSVLAFLIAPRSFKQKYLPAFTTYVNVAVYGNIGMMVFTPAGNTYRGLCSKLACATLFIWIVQQGYHVKWKTILQHDELFVFTAASKPWIFAHAVYRFVLLTQPCFGSGRRHRLLEVYSLGLTWVLSRSSGLPLEWCFGMADTLVVSAVAGWAAVATTFELVPRDGGKVGRVDGNGNGEVVRADWVGGSGDVVLSCVLLAVAGFAIFKILSVPRRGLKGA